jgi:ribosomal protein S13
MKDYERLNKEIILKLENKLERLYSGLSGDAARIVAPYLKMKIPFDKLSKAKQKEIILKIEKKLEAFGGALNNELDKAIKQSIALSDEKNDEILFAALAGLGVATAKKVIAKIRKDRQNRTGELLDAYRVMVSKNVNGLTLSDRVWNLNDGNIETITHYIKSGFGEGKSAAAITKDLKTFLKEPDKLFRRVRNDDGKLVLSKPAKDYHPGQGVYRSSFKNARRLAASEINRAYRMNDSMRWKTTDIVTGYEIKLSKAHPVKDMCDTLKGKYPKNFVFTGWHPQCFCYATPILLEDDEFDKYIDATLEGKDFDTSKSKNTVKNMPSGFHKYVSENKQRISKNKTAPYWVQDNFKGGNINSELNIND